MTVCLHVEPNSLRRGRIGPSTGDIWLAFDDVAFPAPHWNDFVVVILEAWSAAILRVARGTSAFERVHFMEGSYEVEIRPAAQGDLELRAIANRGEVRGRSSLSIPSHIANLVTVVDSILEAAHELGDTSIDAVRLQRSLAQLKTSDFSRQ